MQSFCEEDNAMEGFPGSSFDNFSPQSPMELAGILAPCGEIALQQKLQRLVEGSEGSDMSWSYAIFWRTPNSSSTAKGDVLKMGWGDGYCKGPKLSEVIAIKQAKKGSDVYKEQYKRQMFLRGLHADEELQALVGDGEDGESSREPVLTDMDWLYVLSTFCIFEPAVETFAARNHVWLLTTEAEEFATKNYTWLKEYTPSNIMVSSRGDLLATADIKSLVYVHTGSGVVELGSTELIPERDDSIENIKMRFFERNDDNCTSLASHFLEQESISLSPEFPGPPSMDMYGLRLQQGPYQVLEVDVNATTSVMQGDELDSTAATKTNIDPLDGLSSDEYEIMNKLFNNEHEVQDSIVEPQPLALTYLGAKERTKPSAHASEQQQQPRLLVNAPESLHFPDVDMDNDSQARDLAITSTAEGPSEGAYHHQGLPPSEQWRNLEATGAPAAVYSLSPSDSEKEVELEAEATYGVADTRISSGVESGPPKKRRGRKPKDDRQEPMSHKEAEKIRRKKMKKQETALRAVVPNVTKADRMSLISAAISHIRKLESDLAMVKQHKSELEARQKERNGADGESAGLASRSSVQRTLSVSGSSMSSGTPQQPIQVNVDVLGLEALIRMQSPKACGPAKLLSCLEDLKLEVQHVNMSILTESIVDHSVLVKMKKDNVYTGEQLLGALERIFQRRRSNQTRPYEERGFA